MTSPLIDIRDLRLATSATPSRELLKGLSLTLRAGEVLGIIGESGAGKSTLGLAALGHLRAGVRHTGGQVLYRGQDLLAMPLARRNQLLGRKLTYVAQSASAAFNPAYTLGRQMTETLVRDGMPREAARQRMVALLRKLDLPDPENFGERYPHQVSGGQLQRAMTVMAMVSEPEMVVFDEPTTALDVTTQLEVLAAIKKAIHGQQSAALYISHDLAVVSQICDRIMVLRHGELVEAGTARQVVDAPAREYTRELLAVSRHRGAPEPVSQEDTILTVDKLSLSYGPVQVLHEVSLRLRRGTTLAVVGESGSGKSTLAKTIVGLVPGPRQTLRFDGQALPAALRDRSRDTLRRIQLVFQTPDTALNPRLTIGESLGRPVAFYHGLPASAVARRVEELLAEIELPAEVARRYPGELSGGQKQRVCIARALAAQPDVIICDEVTSALDPLVAQGIIALLARLQRQRGVSYIFITHDLGTVQSIAHDIAVMRGGKVVDCGRRDEVLPPRHPYTRLLFGAEPRTEAGWLEQALRGRSRSEAGPSGELQKAVPDAPMSIG